MQKSSKVQETKVGRHTTPEEELESNGFGVLLHGFPSAQNELFLSLAETHYCGPLARQDLIVYIGSLVALQDGYKQKLARGPPRCVALQRASEPGASSDPQILSCRDDSHVLATPKPWKIKTVFSSFCYAPYIYARVQILFALQRGNITIVFQFQKIPKLVSLSIGT